MSRYRMPIIQALVTSVALFCFAVVVWALASGPVLFHARMFETDDDRSCGRSPGAEMGAAVMNPLRSRSPERLADEFLMAASRGTCLPAWSERTCELVRQHPIHAKAWRLANRLDTTDKVVLFYGLRPPGPACYVVTLDRSGTVWTVSGWGNQ